MKIEENRLLAPLTTFGIGGPARWFAEAACEAEVAEAAAWACERGLPLFVLGGGSNLLVADAGFSGLALKIGLKGIEREGAIFHAAAGEDWSAFVEQMVASDCAGLECLAGIPGTVGGTPVQNVGAYGQEAGALIERVRAFDLEHSAFVEFTGAECGFAYRRSRFNGADRGRYVVTRVDYRLEPGGKPTLRYAELERAVSDAGAKTLAEVAALVCEIRKTKGMLLVEGDVDCRSAGSFFKNPVVSEAVYRQIAASSAGSPPRFSAGTESDQVKIPAAWLIERAGFTKGYALGAAAISSRHTLALVNRGGARAGEILDLAAKIQESVAARFGLRLEMEPVRVGFAEG
jgi:UDP-N-acetylmuramate dehydrogenase